MTERYPGEDIDDETPDWADWWGKATSCTTLHARHVMVQWVPLRGHPGPARAGMLPKNIPITMAFKNRRYI